MKRSITDALLPGLAALFDLDGIINFIHSPFNELNYP